MNDTPPQPSTPALAPPPPPWLQGKLTFIGLAITLAANLLRDSGVAHVPDKQAHDILSFISQNPAECWQIIGVLVATWGRIRTHFHHQAVVKYILATGTPLKPVEAEEALKPGASILPLIALLLASCNVRPVLTAKGDAWLGGSFLTKSSSEHAQIAKADGTVITYDRAEGDETVVPQQYLRAQVLKAGIAASASVLNNATKASATASTTAGRAMPAIAGAAVGSGITAMSSGGSTPAKPKKKPKTTAE